MVPAYSVTGGHCAVHTLEEQKKKISLKYRKRVARARERLGMVVWCGQLFVAACVMTCWMHSHSRSLSGRLAIAYIYYGVNNCIILELS